MEQSNQNNIKYQALNKNTNKTTHTHKKILEFENPTYCLEQKLSDHVSTCLKDVKELSVLKCMCTVKTVEEQSF